MFDAVLFDLDGTLADTAPDLIIDHSLELADYLASLVGQK
jgi:beta-phosphoglucomutase-like phosphatase (HAD superfamily)